MHDGAYERHLRRDCGFSILESSDQTENIAVVKRTEDDSDSVGTKLQYHSKRKYLRHRHIHSDRCSWSRHVNELSERLTWAD
jgi:hypothetical protein